MRGAAPRSGVDAHRLLMSISSPPTVARPATCHRRELGFVPDFIQALRALTPRTRVVIHRRTGSARELDALVEALDCKARVAVQANEVSFLSAVDRLSSDYVLALVATPSEASAATLGDLLRQGVDHVSWSDRTLEPAMIDRAHALDMQVWAWTVDDKDERDRFVADGVDGLITNLPVVDGR